jgi:hypothetical protein
MRLTRLRKGKLERFHRIIVEADFLLSFLYLLNFLDLMNSRYSPA